MSKRKLIPSSIALPNARKTWVDKFGPGRLVLTAVEADRFWKYVNKEGPIIRPELGNCWQWTGCTDEAGYGRFSLRGFLGIRSHRLSYSAAKDDICSKKLLMHECDNPGCVNPRHLRPADDAQNLADMAQKDRSAYGDRSPTSKLKEKEVIQIKELYRTTKTSHKKLARAFGVAPATVSDILRGATWRRAA